MDATENAPYNRLARPGCAPAPAARPPLAARPPRLILPKIPASSATRAGSPRYGPGSRRDWSNGARDRCPGRRSRGRRRPGRGGRCCPGPAPGARDRIASWIALLDRPLTSYYLIIGITALLLGLGLVMVLSTSSVQDLSEGLPAYSDFKKQLLGAAVGLPLMYAAARSSPRVFRAAAYPLLVASVLGLGLTLIPGVAVSQNGAARWIQLGPFPAQPSELAKIALVLWGADLLARKERLRQLEDWRHLLIPLLPGAGLLCMLVMAGDDLGTTFVLLVIFITLLWVIGTPGRIFAGMMALMCLVMLLLAVTSAYRLKRLTGFVNPQGGPMGPDQQGIQGKYALGSGGLFGVGLGASREKWGYVPESTSDFIFAIIGEELGLVGTLCVCFLYGGLAFAGLRVARRLQDTFAGWPRPRSPRGSSCRRW